ncbi:response regulator transcription factor [Ornithinimicrobium faecis]|uniref:Response regulator transcription factor n=1 Tax=Ornithinimicrobium faecis TaxID=2934158 RepID=A0ABY4YUK3_9MICO|nr:response regulator transcription factor [Ornithinimicrobium sp. HY1793]USQ80458.1 response regulator transcription factor [Ornithinimicrobium sp. HY1793]
MRPIAVLPSTAGHATAQMVFQVLIQQRLEYDVLSTAEFTRAQRANRASLVVALVRGLDIPAIELVRSLREQLVPTFLVAEELSETDEVTLLHSGVYDVVRASASPQLIGARLRTMFHHVHEGEPTRTPYQFANVTVRPDHHEVHVDDNVVPVTRTEFRLLVLLAQQPDQVVSKDVLAELLGDSRRMAPHAVESHVSRLRNKITAAGGPRLIESVRGVGYRLKANGNGNQPMVGSSSSPTVPHAER